MRLIKKFILKSISLILTLFCTNTELVFGISKERKEVVKYTEHMANIMWTPAHDTRYWNAKYGIVYKKGKLYKGIPYTQIKRYTSLGRFLTNLKHENETVIYTGPYENGEYYGTDCSWATTLSWREIVDPKFSLNDTMDMFNNLKKNQGGICKVGQYTITGNEVSTREVTKNNGKETIFKAYTNLKPGDAVLKNTYNQVTGRFTGHIRLVKEIDAKNKFITVIEQSGVDNKGILEGDGISSWKDGFKISFNELFDDGYIPVGNKKLLSLDVPQKEEENKIKL